MADLVGQIQRDIEKRLAGVAAADRGEGAARSRARRAHERERRRRPRRAARACRDDAPGRHGLRTPRGKGRRAPRGANREAILTVVRERPGVSAAEVAEITKNRQADGAHHDLPAQAQGHPRTRGLGRRQARQGRLSRLRGSGRSPGAAAMRALGLEPSPPD